jgi:uncharacterized protein involved in response to NO
VPSFTLNALRKRGAAPTPSPAFPRADEAANLALAGVALADLLAPGGAVAGAIAALAAVLCALRLSRWHGWQVASDPLLAVLHGAWAFVPLGLAVKAGALLGGPAWLAGAWLHLLGVGALGLMVMAVMTRASLGHTGRTLRAGALTTTAFVLVAAAALIRGFGPALLPPLSAYGLAGTAWIAGYGLFLWRFAPILLTRRVRGS